MRVWRAGGMTKLVTELVCMVIGKATDSNATAETRRRRGRRREEEEESKRVDCDTGVSPVLTVQARARRPCHNLASPSSLRLRVSAVVFSVERTESST